MPKPRWPARLLFGLSWLILSACGPIASEMEKRPSASPESSWVVVTVEGLRGSLGLDNTFHWSGQSIAGSGAYLPALVSLASGLRPWQHQILDDSGKGGPPGTAMIGEALAELGMACLAWVPAEGRGQGAGWRLLLQGFQRVLREPLDPERIPALLGEMDRPAFLWVHLAERDGLSSDLYRLLLESLPASVGVVLVGVPGPGIPSLERERIEFPLGIRWPQAVPSLEHLPGHVAQTRLWATLVRAAGGSTLPAHAPGLEQAASSSILSELHGLQGEHGFSLLEGETQLLWTTAYVPPDGDRKAWTRLRSPPLHGLEGLAAVRMQLFAWRGEEVIPIEDSAIETRMAAALERRWRAFSGAGYSPSRELRLRRSSSAATATLDHAQGEGISGSR